MTEDFFAPPAFRPAEALASLKRALRELKLAERGAAFEWRGRAVLQLEADEDSISASVAKRPAISPQWERQRLRSHADMRKFIDALKKRLARWEDGDD